MTYGMSSLVPSILGIREPRIRVGKCKVSGVLKTACTSSPKPTVCNFQALSQTLIKVRLYKHTIKCVRAAQSYLTLCDPMNVTGLPRQEYWTELPFHTPGDLPDPESEPVSLGSPALAGGLFFNTKPLVNYIKTIANMQSSLCPNHSLHLAVPNVLEVSTSVAYILVGNAMTWRRATRFFPTPLSVTTQR